MRIASPVNAGSCPMATTWSPRNSIRPWSSTAPDGKLLRRIPVKGMVFAISRLPNGNTLMGTGGGTGMGKSVVEVDAKGDRVWSFETEDFPPNARLEWILGAQRLANGNTLIVNWLGHGKDGKGISLFEVTPQKQVVWTLNEKRTISLVQILPEP